MSQLLTFDDVLIVPKFSTITSRKDVDLTTRVGDEYLTLPVIAANMDTIVGPEMALAMAQAGGRACLHRFASIEEMVAGFKPSTFGYDHDVRHPFVSIGLGKTELERAIAMYQVGANNFIIDVAHGAQQAVVDQANALRGLLPKAYIMVGNFASAQSVQDFIERAPDVSGVKVGVGPGSACTTRIKTGVGYPQFSAVKQIADLLDSTKIQVIADGGMKTPGDIAKALGAGAHLVMLGGMLSGTIETPAAEAYLKEMMAGRRELSNFYKNMTEQELRTNVKDWMTARHSEIKLKYRGSASQESYEAQGKVGKHRTAEGESFLVPCKGPVANILDDIEGGLRSSMTYVGARNLDEFRAKCDFVEISSATGRENGAHGKT